MRRIRVFAGAVVLSILATLTFAAVAVGQDAGSPYGKYTGSAVGMATGGSKESDPVDITVYLRDAGGGQVEVTLVTSKLPIPVSVKATPTKTGSLWEIPLSVSLSAVKLSGTGTLHVVASSGGWELYGDGSGTALGTAGSGRGYAKKVSGSTSTADQVKDALSGFLSFGAPAEEGPLAPPPVYTPPTATSTEFPATSDAGYDEGPLAFWLFVLLFVLLILMLLLGIL